MGNRGCSEGTVEFSFIVRSFDVYSNATTPPFASHVYSACERELGQNRTKRENFNLESPRFESAELPAVSSVDLLALGSQSSLSGDSKFAKRHQCFAFQFLASYVSLLYLLRVKSASQDSAEHTQLSKDASTPRFPSSRTLLIVQPSSNSKKDVENSRLHLWTRPLQIYRILWHVRRFDHPLLGSRSLEVARTTSHRYRYPLVSPQTLKAPYSIGQVRSHENSRIRVDWDQTRID